MGTKLDEAPETDLLYTDGLICGDKGELSLGGIMGDESCLMGMLLEVLDAGLLDTFPLGGTVGDGSWVMGII